MKDFENYKQRMITGIEDWESDLKEMKERAEKHDDENQKSRKEAIAKLEEKIAQSKIRLAELEKSGKDAWEVMKKGMDEAWDDLSRAFKEARSKF
jgi:predicted S18 family serine protease